MKVQQWQSLKNVLILAKLLVEPGSCSGPIHAGCVANIQIHYWSTYQHARRKSVGEGAVALLPHQPLKWQN